MPLLGDGSMDSSYLLLMILFDAGCGAEDTGGVIRVSQAVRQKKCGVESGDPNLRFQPRLPGSVVGEASMRQVEEADKITGVTVLW